MRKQDFVKLVMYVTSKQMSIYDADKLIACRLFIKNDPKECDIHITDADNSLDFQFFEYSDYDHCKFEIDELFNKILNKQTNNEDRN